jgi:hypothetical protein
MKMNGKGYCKGLFLGILCSAISLFPSSNVAAESIQTTLSYINTGLGGFDNNGNQWVVLHAQIQGLESPGVFVQARQRLIPTNILRISSVAGAPTIQTFVPVPVGNFQAQNQQLCDLGISPVGTCFALFAASSASTALPDYTICDCVAGLLGTVRVIRSGSLEAPITSTTFISSLQ